MLKSLHKNDTQTIPYIATKNWELSNVANEDLILMEHSGSDGFPVAIEYLDYGPTQILVSYGCNLAKEQQDLDKIIPRSGLKTTGIFYPELDLKNTDGTYQRVVYSQIATTFYNRFRDPTKMWGMEEIDFERSQTKRFIADKFKLFDIPQIVFGEKVLENTVVLYDTTTDNDYIITDDGHCNLFAGTNLFSRQQEVRHIKNEFALGFDYFCDGYNNNTGSPNGDINLTASLWATPVLTASLYAGSQSLVTWSYELTNNDFFLLQRSVDSGSTWPNNYLLPSSSLQYVDTVVVTFGDYWYRVAATSYFGIGLFSNIGTVHIPGVPPLSPINLTVVSGSAILNWTIGSIDTDYYHIEKSINPTGSGYSYFGTSSTTTDTDNTVTSSLRGTTYWYQVAAVNEWGTSSFSNTASITFTEPLLPPLISNPADQIVYLGETATFIVTASQGDNDGLTPMTFAWISGSTFLLDNLRISGSYHIGGISSSLTITDAQFSDSGTYKVQVGNIVATVVSDTASLTVLDNAVIMSGSDSSSFDITLYQGSAVPQATPDADLGPVSVGMYSGSLATIIITSSAEEFTSSVGYDLVGGKLTTVVLYASGSEATASVGYDLVGGNIATIVIIESGEDFISDAVGVTTPGLNIGLYSGSLSP